MLSQNENTGLRTILQDIEDEELFSILETVTKHMFTTSSRLVAVEKILSCTGKPSDLLRRQKVTKKILFNYLVKRGCVVLADWGKLKLVKKCLELWGSSECCKESDFSEMESENQCPDTKVEMGVEFSKWFFKNLNALNDFGPEHFWPSCKLSAELYTPQDHKEISVSGANDAATFLANLIIMDKYYFHANESVDSVMFDIEQHGLIKVLVRGILHQHSNCIGLFDTAFGLVENPECLHTYKIQMIKLKMQVNYATVGSLPANNYLSICQTV